MDSPPLGLYVHLPWCERKCPYCDFNSHETAQIPEQGYISQLLKDLEREAAALGDREVSTLFIGGGTPSLFSGEAITALMGGIAARLPLAATLEATMEANPGSAEADKFAAFHAAGVNRLSIGVQSFQDAQLQALGRVHDSDTAHRAVASAKAAGFTRFNIDLMHGLPEQNDNQAQQDLRTAMELGAPHISWYQLTLEPNTVFYKAPPALPDENLLADIQDVGEALLAEGGYQQYEVSAYGRAGDRCKHNINYWSFGDYIGIGAGAHGKLTSHDGSVRRYSKTRKPDDYLSDDGFKRVGEKLLSTAELPGEFMMNALRLNTGFEIADFTARTGLAWSTVAETVEQQVARGLLEESGNTVRASAVGRRFLDTLIAEFLVEP